jgi:hypothetical protein
MTGWKKNFGEDTRWVENGEALRRSALRISTRQWIAEKLKPKKYSAKVGALAVTGIGAMAMGVTFADALRRLGAIIIGR